MTTKHTPGPWDTRKVLLQARNGEDDCAWTIEQPGHMPHATVFDRAKGNDTEETAANARLIAAAPALLAALRSCLDDMSLMRRADNCDPVNTYSMDNGWAAIAKAEGNG